MARPGRKKRTALFIVEIICLLLFIGGLYVYGQIDSRLNKIKTPQLDAVSYTHLLSRRRSLMVPGTRHMCRTRRSLTNKERKNLLTHLLSAW